MLGFMIAFPFLMTLFIMVVGRVIPPKIFQMRFLLVLFTVFMVFLCLSYYPQIAQGDIIFQKITLFSSIVFYFSMGTLEFLMLNLCSFLTFCVSLRILAFYDDVFYYSNNVVIFIFLTLGGAYGMILSDGLWNILLFYCVTNIAVYYFIKTVSPKSSLWQFYLKKTSFATVLLGVAIGTLLLIFGDITLYDLARLLPSVSSHLVTLLIFIFCFSFLAKVEFYPFNNWLSVLYQKIDSQNVSFITAVPAKAYFMVFFQIIAIFLHNSVWLAYVLVGFGVVSMVFASIKAFFYQSIKRILAFSLMTQVGFMLFCVGFGSSIINEGVLFIFFNSSVALVLMYLSISYITHNKNTDRLESLQGCAREDIFSVGFFILGAMCVIGFPPFSGFWGKIFILQGLAEQKNFWAVLLVLFVFFLETILYFKLIRVFFLRVNIEKEDRFLDFLDYIPLLLLGAVLVFFSFYPFVIFELLANAVGDFAFIQLQNNLLLR